MLHRVSGFSMMLEYCTVITLKIAELESLIISLFLQKDIFLSRKLEPKTQDLTLFFEFVKEKLLVQKAILYSENQRHFILCGSHFCHYFKWTGVT